MIAMQLFATPLSHFSRKVRLLLDHYELDYEFIDVGNVANANVDLFQGNPLMKVPVLRDAALWLIESDHIAAYLARKYDPEDQYQVLTTAPAALNTRAVLNGIMADEVKIILAERTGLGTKDHAFFQKARASIENSLRWLEDHAGNFNPRRAGYLEFHLACMWEHLQYYALVQPDHPALGSIVMELQAQDRIRRTAPQVLKPKT